MIRPNLPGLSARKLQMRLPSIPTNIAIPTEIGNGIINHMTAITFQAKPSLAFFSNIGGIATTACVSHEWLYIDEPEFLVHAHDGQFSTFTAV